MIRHIVFFSARTPEQVETIYHALKKLEGIPAAAHLEIALNERKDQLSDEVDIVVYGEFVDEAALAAYKAHPLYEAAIQVVRPLREMRIAVDYQIPERR